MYKTQTATINLARCNQHNVDIDVDADEDADADADLVVGKNVDADVDADVDGDADGDVNDYIDSSADADARAHAGADGDDGVDNDGDFAILRSLKPVSMRLLAQLRIKKLGKIKRGSGRISWALGLMMVTLGQSSA